MYFGWCFCEKISRSNEKETVSITLSFLSSNAICLIIESLIMMAEGEKLNDALEEVGAELLQFKAQHNCAADTSAVLSLLFALSQHSIIRLLPVCRGIPASTPPIVKIKNNDANHLTISVKPTY